MPDYAKAIISTPDIARYVSVNVNSQALKRVSESVKVHTKISLGLHPYFTLKMKNGSSA